jgi:anti-sigma regulatory factor (Ser/Thr protein kinase)/RimJ/RimL family protein N-acetyltransferase
MASSQIAELISPAEKTFLPLARAFVQELSLLAGLSSQEVQYLELAAEEVCIGILDQNSDSDEKGTFTLRGELSRTALILAVLDQGLPFDPCTVPGFSPLEAGEGNWTEASNWAGLRLYLIRNAVDRVEWINHGPEGNEVRLTKYLPQPHITEQVAEAELTPFHEAEPLAPEQSYTVRRLLPEDAIGVSQCLYRAYGYSYPDDYMYYPKRIINMNETEELTSVVALDEAGSIVGHCALVHHDHGSVAELDHAVVAPANRKGGLLKRMTALLEEEACCRSLQGIYVQAVTSHTFSQRVIEQLGYRECALFMGLLPRSMIFKKIRADSLSQRESCAVHYKTIGAPLGSIVYAPDRHLEILRQTYLNLGMHPQFLDGSRPEGQGALRASYHSSLGFGEIKVLKVGGDSRTEIKRGLLDLLEIAGAETVYLDLPLAQAGTPDLCTAAEAEGFFYSGLGPRFAADGDVLTLQYLKGGFDTSQVQMASVFGQKLLDYIARERMLLLPSA